jgi:hypothetical protein
MVAEEIIHKVVDEIAFGLISPKDAPACCKIMKVDMLLFKLV